MCQQSVVLEYNHSVMRDSMRANYLTEKIMRMTKRTIWALQQQLKKGILSRLDMKSVLRRNLRISRCICSTGIGASCLYKWQD
ncbi:MAG: hypothetical protein ACLR1V_06760 [Coprococcus sp.]